MKLLYTFLLLFLGISTRSVNSAIIIYDKYVRIVAGIRTIDASDIDTMEGYIESANPPGACSILTLSSFPDDINRKKFVLINGTTECDFMTKVGNAISAGYDAAVLFNPSVAPFEYPNMTFPVPKSEVNISVVLVLSEDGILIRDNYLYNKSNHDNFVFEIIPTNGWRTYLGYAILSIAALVVLRYVSKFLFEVCMAFIDCCKEKREERRMERQRLVLESHRLVLERERRARAWMDRITSGNEAERLKMSLDNLQKYYPVVQYSKDLSLRDHYCNICSDDFIVDEAIRILKCSHAFHPFCIDSWLLNYGKKSSNCPYCTKKVKFHGSTMAINSKPSENAPLLLSSSYPSYSNSTSESNHYVRELLAKV